MKKNILIFGLLFLCNLIFAQVRIGILNGPSCVPMGYMMENVVSISDEDLEYSFFSDAQSVVPKLLKNEIDICFLPVNVAAKIYNLTNKSIICAAITGEGNLSVITHNRSITDFSKLKGKKLYVAGQGATPEYMTKYLLDKNNIKYNTKTNDSLTLDFSIPTAQIPSQLITGKIDYAVVPEPFSTIASMADSTIVAKIDLQKEYKNVTGNQENYPLTLLVVNSKFAKDKNQIMNEFLKLYKESYQFTMLDTKNAALMCEKYNLGLKAAVLEKSIPSSNYVYIPAYKGKTQIEQLLSIFMENDPSSIGGKLPDDSFYY